MKGVHSGEGGRARRVQQGKRLGCSLYRLRFTCWPIFFFLLPAAALFPPSSLSNNPRAEQITKPTHQRTFHTRFFICGNCDFSQLETLQERIAAEKLEVGNRQNIFHLFGYLKGFWGVKFQFLFNFRTLLQRLICLKILITFYLSSDVIFKYCIPFHPLF